ncbi:MAG: DNA repair exonuclease [bacterium]|nr:DNA repair exonuclease [bacterium]MDE0242445.1 DNA repair exonuclease [bacterium]MDE0416678.1 DNA repair exonuclease [bacterium]
MSDSATLLAIGDVHLGTRCSGIPDAVMDWGIDPADLTPAATLERCADLAIDRHVAAVLFAGDVVDSSNARFEAMVPLEACTRRLLDAGIEVIAVAGNHDVEALPRMASLVDGFRLLGADGTWQAHVVSRHGAAVAEIIGWSFPTSEVRQSPVADLLRHPPARTSADVPRIGLLHADLGASGGAYAPVRQAELDDVGCDAWLLGHIHKPSLAGGSCGYLGSLAALDPSETGPRGPWLITLLSDGRMEFRQEVLSPVRWEEVTVSLDDGVEDADDVADRLLAEAGTRCRELAGEGPLPRVLGLKARLGGSIPCQGDVMTRLASGDWADLGRAVDGTAVFYSRIVPAMTPARNLHRIAEGSDPAALLARRLAALEEGGEAAQELLRQARSELADVAGDPHWAPVDDHRHAIDPLADGPLRDMLVRAGRAALDAMLAGERRGECT